MGKYDDIINLPHHVSDYHKPMPIENRAAQFAPFAALSGHDDAIMETYRVTDNFKELTEDEKKRISTKLRFAIENKAKIRLTYFIPDKKKKGGSYKSFDGEIRKWIEEENLLLMDKGIHIPIMFISEIKIIEG